MPIVQFKIINTKITENMLKYVLLQRCEFCKKGIQLNDLIGRIDTEELGDHYIWVCKNCYEKNIKIGNVISIN